ncbi:glutamate-rich protein 3-like [Uloborus diversus]|uniref:glutamate-rich protein 3-like n=1 Tax=Uloborus diversus TaxID=327109 RepID=UPI0024094866|nr:glutamate-rich protein 3-like [Uloborus diversus]
MAIKILLLFLTVAFIEVEANRVHRTQDDATDNGPVFPYEAFGIGYEDFINRIHPPLIAAMNYRPVMPHDIPQSTSDGQMMSVVLSSNIEGVVEPNEEAAKSEYFTSDTLEVLPSQIEEPVLESIISPTTELETSNGESSTKTVETATSTDESAEEIYVEPENVSDSSLEAETPEYQIDKPSTLSEYSAFHSDKEGQTSEEENQNEKLPDSRDKLKDSAEELAETSRDEASAAVYESEVSEPNEDESPKLRISHETEELPHLSSEDFVAKPSGEMSDSSSDDDYYYYVPDYKYTESEVFDEVSDDVLTTSSYEYSDSTSEYYSTELVESEEKVIVFPESQNTQNSKQSYSKGSESVKTSQLDAESKMSHDSKERESSETHSTMMGKDRYDEQKSSNDENSEHNVNEKSKVELDLDSKRTLSVESEAVLSEASKPAHVSSEPVSFDSESQMASSSSSKKELGESDSGKTTFSANGEAAASISFSASSRSSAQSGDFVNIPHIMEDLMVLKEATKVYGQKLDFESMRKIVEQAITELSSLRKRLTRKEYVLGDLNQVIDELQKLCQAICANVPEKYLMPESGSISISSKSKRR